MKAGTEIDQKMKIDASGIYYRELNMRLKELASNGTKQVELHNLYGQRYIGTSLTRLWRLRFTARPAMTSVLSWTAPGLPFTVMPRMAAARLSSATASAIVRASI